jgi:hypothetical protein
MAGVGQLQHTRQNEVEICFIELGRRYDGELFCNEEVQMRAADLVPRGKVKNQARHQPNERCCLWSADLLTDVPDG